MWTPALTSAALVAFAANSILCRLALGSHAIDAYSFTAIRIGSGALLLWGIRLPVRQRGAPGSGSRWSGPFFLILYALPFSLAYVRLDAGTGALLLFGAVQLTMIGHGLRSGDSPRRFEWVGLWGALAGLIYLVSPGLSAPDPLGAGLMVIAGVGRGAYSISGKGIDGAQAATTHAFTRAATVLVPLTAIAGPALSITGWGVFLAVASGALASGLGYTIWYAALRHLSLPRAALVQLSVSVIAAAGGVVILGEVVTPRYLISSGAVLGSIALGLVLREAGDQGAV